MKISFGAPISKTWFYNFILFDDATAEAKNAFP